MNSLNHIQTVIISRDCRIFYIIESTEKQQRNNIQKIIYNLQKVIKNNSTYGGLLPHYKQLNKEQLNSIVHDLQKALAIPDHSETEMTVLRKK